MKKICRTKLWIVLAIVILTLILVGWKGNSDKYGLSDLISEKMTANYLYTELAERYPDDEIFADLAEEAVLDVEALEKEAARLGISVEGAKAEDIDIPATKTDALNYAVLFEQAEKRMLNKMIKKEDNAHLKKVLGDMLKSSESNNSILKAALEEENPLVLRYCTRCKTRGTCPIQNSTE